jgi:hypothetical protein
MLLTKAFSKKTRLAENEGFGATTPDPSPFRDAASPLSTPSRVKPSLRAQRSNPASPKTSWIASSQALLAMTANPA